MLNREKHKDKMNVAYACDNNYIIPTAVSIYSMLINLDSMVECYLYILVPDSITTENILIIENVSNVHSNCILKIINMGKVFDEVSFNINHLSIQTYYRLLLSDTLNECNKCLYLDSDTVIDHDVYQLYKTNLSGYFIAGVKSINYVLSNSRISYSKQIGIKDVDGYINAGVIIFNLSEIRRNNVMEKSLKLLDKKLPANDQDIINIICYSKIKYVDWKYNFSPILLDRQDYKLRYVFSKKEIIEAKKSAVIYHYINRVKPWNCKHEEECSGTKLWWRYAICSPIQDKVIEKYGNYPEFDYTRYKNIHYKIGIGIYFSGYIPYQKYIVKYASYMKYYIDKLLKTK